MKTETKVLGIIAIITLLMLGGAIYLLGKNQAPAQETTEGTVYQIDYTKGHKIGTDSAKVKLVEFSDLQCPACKAADPTVKQILGENNPNLQFIYRHFPLSGHQNARQAQEAVEEANVQGKFWEMHDKLFETQEQWGTLPDPSDFFVNLGKEIGMPSPEKIKDAVHNNTYSSIIEADLQEGNSLNVNATPTFFLNGKKVFLNSYQDLKTETDKALQNP